MQGRLTGRLAFVALDEGGAEPLALALAREGATVVVVTADGARGGRLADDIAGTEGRVAVFCTGTDTTADLEALVELGTELAPRP